MSRFIIEQILLGDKFKYRLQKISARRINRLLHDGFEQRKRIFPDASRNDRLVAVGSGV